MLRTRASGPGAGDKTWLQTGRARLGRSTDSVRGSGVSETEREREGEMRRKVACIPVRCLGLFGVTGLYIQKVKMNSRADLSVRHTFSQTTILFHHQKTP